MDSTERYFKLGLGSLGLAMVLSVACSSEFKDCEDSRSCASDSEAGAGGEGGAGADTQGGRGGSSPSKGGTTGSAGDAAGGGDAGREAGGAGGSGGDDSGLCTSDDDCNDHLDCNGTETCVDQHCQPGTSPCTETPPEHCRNSCTEDATGPICGFEGADADSDGYLDIACVENPGDDCNDSAEDGAAVNPGAGEVCNTVDDDCDGVFGWDDEMRYDDAGVVLVEAVGTTVRGEPSIAAVPGGGFGLVWSDAAEGNAQIHYRYIGADGSLGEETVPGGDFALIDVHDPDIAVRGSVFKVVARGDANGEPFAVGRFDVEFDGASATEMTVIVDSGGAVGKPQISNDDVYVQFADDEVQQCETGCVAFGAEPVYADSFDAASASGYLALARAGDVFTRASGSGSLTLLPENVAQTRTNSVVVGIPTTYAVAYRYELGVWLGVPSAPVDCLVPDGIPIDLDVAVGVKLNLLMGSVDETALAIHSATVDGCDDDLNATVVKENGNSIDSGAMAIDQNGVVAVVWSSEDPSTGEWRIMGRFLDPAACE